MRGLTSFLVYGALGMAVGIGAAGSLLSCSSSSSTAKGDLGDHDSSTGADGDVAEPDLSLTDLTGADLTYADLRSVGPQSDAYDAGGTLTCHAYHLCVAACADDPCKKACYGNTSTHAKDLLQAIADCEFYDCFNGANPQCMPSERTGPTTISCSTCEKFAAMFGMGKCPTEFQDCDNDI